MIPRAGIDRARVARPHVQTTFVFGTGRCAPQPQHGEKNENPGPHVQARRRNRQPKQDVTEPPSNRPGLLSRVLERVRLRDQLAVTVLVAVLPIALLASYLLLQQAHGQAEDEKTGMERTADTLGRNVDRQVLASIEALAIVARAGSLMRPDGGFSTRELAELSQARRGWQGLFVLDGSGHPMLDTLQPASDRSPLSYPTREQLPFASEWSIAIVQNEAARSIAIVVPIRRESGARLFLGTRIDIATLQEVLEAQPRDPRRIRTLLDSSHRVLATTAPDPQLIGRSLHPSTVSVMEEMLSGVARTIGLDGAPQYVAWRVLATSGWTVEVSTPAAVVDGIFRSSIHSALLIGGTSLLLGLALALPLAQRIIRPLHALATQGAAGLPEGSSIREIRQLRDSMADADARTRSTHQMLVRSAEEFRTLFETSPVGLAFIEDPECKLVRTNLAFDLMTGGDASVASMLSEGTTIAWPDNPICRAATHGIAARDVLIEIEDPSGENILTIVNAQPLRDDGGNVRGAIVAMLDITSLKRTEARLRAAERDLRKSQDFMDLAQDAARVGFFQYDFGSDVGVWSAGHAKLFGGPAGTVPGALHLWEQAIDPADRSRVKQELQALLAARAESGILEYRVALTADPYWVSTRVCVTYGAAGRPADMLGISMDISEQKSAEAVRERLAEQEQAALQASQAANRAKDQFLSMLGHELRNPLGGLTAAAAVLQRVDPGSGVGAEAVAIVARQTENLRRMIDDLLDTARVVTGKVALERRPLNLAELVAKTTAGDAERTVRVELILEEVWIDGDWHRVTQIVTKLVRNALKHAAGGPTAVSTRRDGPRAVLEVMDSGSGIPPHLLESMFDPFVQGDSSLDRKSGGLGIGLTLVRQLVWLHGGTITARSSPQGTTIVVGFVATERPG